MLNGCVPEMQHMIHVKWVCPGDAGAHDTC